MKTIIANLKLYIPNRYFWLAYLFCLSILGIMIGAVANNKKDEVIMIGLFMNLPLWVGFLAALLQIDIFSKPVSFCLPGHRQSVKKVLLIVSVIASVILAFIAAMHIFGNQWDTMIVPLFFLNFIFLLLAIELTLFTKKILILFWFMMFSPSFYIRPYQILGELIIMHPLILIGIGLLCSISIWLKLNFSDIHRKLCANQELSIADMWNREKINKYNQSRLDSQQTKVKGEIKPSVERFFLNKMESYKYFGMGRYIWGNLYKNYGFMFSNIKLGSILFIYGIIFLFCYAWQSSIFSLFMVVLMLTAFSQLPVHSTMIISGGRKERYYGAISLSIAHTLFVFLFCFGIIVLTNIAEPLMPNIDYSGRTYTFHGINYAANLMPIILVPFVFAFKLFFHKRLSLMVIAIAVIYALFVVFLIAIEKIFNINVKEIPSMIINPTFVISFIILLWAIFLAVLRRVCFKRSLV